MMVFRRPRANAPEQQIKQCVDFTSFHALNRITISLGIVLVCLEMETQPCDKPRETEQVARAVASDVLAHCACAETWGHDAPSQHSTEAPLPAVNVLMV
jgi:hypothetical protein